MIFFFHLAALLLAVIWHWIIAAKRNLTPFCDQDFKYLWKPKMPSRYNENKIEPSIIKAGT